jgi:hypothetical protein
MRIVSIVLLQLLFAVPVAAQVTAGPGAQVAWDHDRVNTTRFEAVIDGNTNNPRDIGLPATNLWPLPALTGGNHSVALRACNTAGCSAWSTALQIQVIVVPGVPTNLRLAPATINNAQRAPVPAPSPAQAIASVRSGKAPPAVPGAPRFE